MSKRATLKAGKKVKRPSSASSTTENTIKCPGCGRPLIVGMHPGVVISNLNYRCQCGTTTTINVRG
ncbi:MAG: hypothetical protein JRN38_05410 [Nitrososphaerota archaeon]|nr:hypothetical protein [Nitrososphaerota archaeon]